MPRVIGRTVMVGLLAAVLLLAGEHTSVDLDIPATAHAMVGVALGLLLVFRTNASYARYWEGRILLGGVTSNCRDLARLCARYLAHLDEAGRDQLAREITCFAAVLGARLRGESPAEAARPLVGDRADELTDLHAPPMRTIAWLGRRFADEADRGTLSEHRLQTLEGALSDLIDLWGGCERILKTPVPFAYAHHIKSFLTIFCFTAPFTMVGPMGWYAPAASAIVAFGLYGIDEIGVEIEEPFGRDANDLPLDAIIETIGSNVRESLSLPV